MTKFMPILQEHVGNSRLEFEQLVDRGGTLFVKLINGEGRQIELRFESSSNKQTGLMKR